MSILLAPSRNSSVRLSEPGVGIPGFFISRSVFFPMAYPLPQKRVMILATIRIRHFPLTSPYKTIDHNSPGSAGDGCVHEPHITGGEPESFQDPNFRGSKHDPGKCEECDPRNVPCGPGKAYSPLSVGILLSLQPTVLSGRPPSPVCVCCGQNIAPSLHADKAS